MRLQALVRGRQVRKQAAVTLRCMQALVRVQARVRARRVRMSIEGQAVQQMLDEHRSKADRLKQAEVDFPFPCYLSMQIDGFYYFGGLMLVN